MSRRHLSIALLVAIALAVPSVMLATHSWGGYHWARQTSQFTLKLGDNMTADWKPYLQQTSIDWNAGNSAVLTAIVPGTSSKRCRMVAEIGRAHV